MTKTVDPRIKTAACIWYLMWLLVPPDHGPHPLFLQAALLLGTLALSPRPRGAMRLIAVLTVVLAVFLVTGPPILRAPTAMRLTLIVLALSVYSETTTFHAQLAAFQGLRAPRLVVTSLMISHHFVRRVIDQGIRMHRSLAVRCAGAIPVQRAKAYGAAGLALSNGLGERGEAVAMALQARGFEGKIPPYQLPPVRPFDVVSGALFAALVVLLAEWKF